MMKKTCHSKKRAIKTTRLGRIGRGKIIIIQKTKKNQKMQQQAPFLAARKYQEESKLKIKIRIQVIKTASHFI